MAMTLRAVHADITTLEVDAIVNAANRALRGGGGVDGAIHRAAGPGLLAECRQHDGCETGDAVVTGGHALAARYVIHTVGPVWQGGESGEEVLLASCYRRCLEEAAGLGVASMAFPGIGTGVYGFPPERAAPIAIDTVRGFDAQGSPLAEVLFCCFGTADIARYEQLLGAPE